MIKLFVNNLYFNALKNIKALMTLEEKKKGIYMILLLIFNVITDVIGLLGIFPLLAVADDFNIVQENSTLLWFYKLLDEPAKFNFLLILSLFLLVIFTIKNGIALAIQYFQSIYAFDISLSLSKKQLQHNFKKGYSFINNEDSANLIYKIMNIPLLFAKFYIMPTFNLTTEIIVLLLIFIGLLIYNPILVLLVILVMLPGFGLIYFVTKQRVKRAGNKRNKIYPVAITSILESMNGFVDIKLSNKEQTSLEEYGALRYKINKIDALVEGLYKKVHQRANEVILALGILGIFTFGALFPNSQTDIIFTMGTFGVAALRVMPSFNRIMTAMLNLKNFSYTAEQLRPLSNKNLEVFPTHNKMKFEQEIKIKNVSFAYSDMGLPTLNDISLSIKKGKTIGIIGSSGSGKTTLLNIILQFLQPTSGEIRVDNQVLNDELAGSFQKILGYVKQQVFIKDASIRENIAFDKNDIKENQVLKAVEDAQLNNFVAELPNGLDTILGENGANLSGGQKQRIGIARALYKDAEILLFDEITSALDTETEIAITESIANLAKLNKTVIIVAHRISTLRHCDKIYELKAGKVVREVSYKELMKNISE